MWLSSSYVAGRYGGANRISYRMVRRPCNDHGVVFSISTGTRSPGATRRSLFNVPRLLRGEAARPSALAAFPAGRAVAVAEELGFSAGKKTSLLVFVRPRHW